MTMPTRPLTHSPTHILVCHPGSQTRPCSLGLVPHRPLEVNYLRCLTYSVVMHK